MLDSHSPARDGVDVSIIRRVAHAGRTRERAHEIFTENAETAHDFFPARSFEHTGVGRRTRETRAAVWTMFTATQLGLITAAVGVGSRVRA